MAGLKNNGNPSFLIKTHGCKVNQYESQLIREQLIQAGFEECAGGDEPSLCIVNTCTVTEQSDAKSRQSLRSFIRRHPGAAVAAVGCSVEAEGSLLKEVDGVDLWLKNDAKQDLVAKISPLIKCSNGSRPSKMITRFEGHTRAFIKVQDGCDRYCSYCKIPYVRGRSRSRNISEILSEAETLAINGYKEVVLTGIHLGDFGKSRENSSHKLVELLEKLSAIEQIERIRLSSIDPDEVTDDLIRIIANCPKVCHHLHISIQSGSDSVLERMNRRYSARFCLGLAKRLYKRIPDISISTDIMAGFPGENEEAFCAGVNLIEQIGFSKVHIFGFSPRPQTAAAKMPNQVSRKIIKKRTDLLKETTARAALNHRKKFIGTIQEILVERFDPIEHKAIGLTGNYLKCEIDCPDKADVPLEKRLISSKIQDAGDKLLFGEGIY